MSQSAPGGPNPVELSDFHKRVFDAIPHPVFVVDSDVRIIACNAAAQEFSGAEPARVLHRRGGDALHCINSFETPAGCGSGVACRECVIRNAVREAFAGGSVARRTWQMALLRPGGQRVEFQLLVTSSPIEFSGRTYALLILEDVSELLALRKMIPICAGCRKIRDDEQYWHQVETYFKAKLGVDFTHGLCPECATRLYPEFTKEIAE